LCGTRWPQGATIACAVSSTIYLKRFVIAGDAMVKMFHIIRYPYGGSSFYFSLFFFLFLFLLLLSTLLLLLCPCGLHPL